MNFTLKPGDTGIKVPVNLDADENGAHGACIIKSAALMSGGASIKDLTPADPIMREEALAIATTGTVTGVPVYSAGGGPGGENIYQVTLGTGEGASFAAGDYVRSQTAGKKGVYKVLAITGDVLDVHAKTGELDPVDTDVLEKCTPDGSYQAELPLAAADLGSNRHAYIEIELDILDNTNRANDPAFLNAANRRVLHGVELETSAASYHVS